MVLGAELLSTLESSPVSFRNGVNPWLPFRRLESMVVPDLIPGLLEAC
jgi:hypothetical protein